MKDIRQRLLATFQVEHNEHVKRFRDGLTVSSAVERIRERLAGIPEVEHFARFAETSARGLTR